MPFCIAGRSFLSTETRNFLNQPITKSMAKIPIISAEIPILKRPMAHFQAQGWHHFDNWSFIHRKFGAHHGAWINSPIKIFICLCRLYFKLKCKADSSIEHHKALLIVISTLMVLLAGQYWLWWDIQSYYQIHHYTVYCNLFWMAYATTWYEACYY